MDDERFDSAPDETPDDAAAPTIDAANDAPDDDEAPVSEPEDAGGEDESDPEEPAEDPNEELARLRRERDEFERAANERAERDAQERARQQQLQAQQAEAQRRFQRQSAWTQYQTEKARISEQRIADAETVRTSDDPATIARFLEAQRRQEDAAADWRYHQWAEQDRQAELLQTQQALERAATREYADYVRDAYNLPHDTIKEILTYADGTPVHHDNFAARAAEIVARRKTEANYKRQITRLQREQSRDELRGRTGYAPGSGRGQPAGGREIEGTIQELHELFPMGGRRDRQRSAG